MPKYYLHIRGADGASRDEEGTDLLDLNAARAEALAAARDVRRRNSLSLRSNAENVVITDDAGQELDEVRSGREDEQHDLEQQYASGQHNAARSPK